MVDTMNTINTISKLCKPRDTSGALVLCFISTRLLANSTYDGALDTQFQELKDRPFARVVLCKPVMTGVHSNQDLIWCEKMGVYMGFWVHRGS